MSFDTEQLLNDTWKIYFHDPSSNDWEKTSYVELGEISTIYEFWNLYEVLKPQLHKGMFFVMREHIFPKWDDECNKQGSFASIKILKNALGKFGEEIIIRLLGETLINYKIHDTVNWDVINGISFSPKKHFCIVKIWMKNSKLNKKEAFNISNVYNGELLFKRNEYV